VDFRSDQFSFSSILYEMMTGKWAFQKKRGEIEIARVEVHGALDTRARAKWQGWQPIPVTAYRAGPSSTRRNCGMSEKSRGFRVQRAAR
jgi:hypothetical protein